MDAIEREDRYFYKKILIKVSFIFLQTKKHSREH